MNNSIIKSVSLVLKAVAYMATHRPFSWTGQTTATGDPVLCNGEMVLIGRTGSIQYMTQTDFDKLKLLQLTEWEALAMDTDGDCGLRPASQYTCPYTLDYLTKHPDNEGYQEMLREDYEADMLEQAEAKEAEIQLATAQLMEATAKLWTLTWDRDGSQEDFIRGTSLASGISEAEIRLVLRQFHPSEWVVRRGDIVLLLIK